MCRHLCWSEPKGPTKNNIFSMYGKLEVWTHSHRIHGTGIFTYIWHKFMVNVGKYTSPMDSIETLSGAIFLKHFWKQHPKWFATCPPFLTTQRLAYFMHHRPNTCGQIGMIFDEAQAEAIFRWGYAMSCETSKIYPELSVLGCSPKNCFPCLRRKIVFMPDFPSSLPLKILLMQEILHQNW